MPKPGSTKARGYGAEHRKTRARLAVLVEQGEAVCSRCNQPIIPGSPWDLDHAADRQTYLGPAHRRCNRKAGGIASARQRNRRTLTW